MTRTAILTAAAILGLNATATIAATPFEQACFENVRVACTASASDVMACIEVGNEACDGLGDGSGADTPMKIKLIKLNDDSYKFRILPNLPTSNPDVDNEHQNENTPNDRRTTRARTTS